MIVGICDDEPIVAKLLAQLVEQAFTANKIEADIKTFFSGESILANIEDYDAVFLDIDMPIIDGIEVGSAIYKRNENCRVIMATGRADRYKDAFKINAFRFITKPFDAREIDEVIVALTKIKIGENAITLFLNRLQYDISQKYIKYFIAFNGYTEAIIKDKCYRKDVSLNELETELDQRIFVRVHKKYIVNLNFVKLNRNNTIKIDDVIIPISRRKQKEFEKKYMDFYTNIRGC